MGFISMQKKQDNLEQICSFLRRLSPTAANYNISPIFGIIL